MPSKLKHPCSYPGCPELATERFCEAHKKQDQRQQDERRGTAASRGYDGRWQKARDGHLRHHPLCAECERQERVTAATVVDHIIPHRGNMVLFWSRDNWQSLCKPCHDKKTARGE